MGTSFDNLSQAATASEMEQAILADEKTKTETQTTDSMVSAEAELHEGEKAEEAVENVTTEQVKEEAPKPEVSEKPPSEDATEEGQDFDYKKGYEGLRSWNTRLSQDVAEMKRNMETKPASVEQKQPESPTLSQDQVEDWQTRDPIGFARHIAKLEAQEETRGLRQELDYLKSVVGKNEAKSTVEELRGKFSDFKDFEDTIRDEVVKLTDENNRRIASKLPPLRVVTPDTYGEFLEDSYWKLKGRNSVEIAKKAKEAGMKEAQQRTQDKKDAYVEGSGKTTPEKPLDMSSASSEEIFNLMKARGLVRN